MDRGHVHFAPGLPGMQAPAASPAQTGAKEEEREEEGSSEPAEVKGEPAQPTADRQPVISGMRASASVLVWVDVRRSMAEGGIRWWRSSNGVVLSEGDERGFVPVGFVTRAVDRRSGEVIWEAEKGR